MNYHEIDEDLDDYIKEYIYDKRTIDNDNFIISDYISINPEIFSVYNSTPLYGTRPSYVYWDDTDFNVESDKEIANRPELAKPSKKVKYYQELNNRYHENIRRRRY